jgi:hypothetical protein
VFSAPERLHDAREGERAGERKGQQDSSELGI